MESTKNDTDSKGLTYAVKGDEFKMPKNLRQIGSINDMTKVIYVEDYVMSYMKQLSQKEQSESKIAVLLGKYIYSEDVKNIFIKGTIEMTNVDIRESDSFTDESWTDVYIKIKEYFSDVEIVGWAIMGLGIMFDSEDKIEQIHTENFNGPNKVLLKFDAMEKEEHFYLVENNQFIQQKGYYIYYEKNEEMQNYMIEHNEKQKELIHEEYDDLATKRIRTVIEDKNSKKIEKSTTRLTYAAGTLLAVIVLMVASTMLRNYHQMKNLETALYSLTENLGTSANAEGDKEVSSNNIDIVNNQPKSESPETVDSMETVNEQTSSNNENEQPNNGSDNVDVETVPGNVSETEEASQAQTPLETETETQGETNEAISTTNEIKYYIVRTGDSLASICGELYNNASQEKIDEIIQLNGIEDQNRIYAGQQLEVP